MVVHMHHRESLPVGAVRVIEHSKYMVEIGSLEDPEARAHVTFPIFEGQLAVLPEHIMGKCMCASKIGDTMKLIKNICLAQLPSYGAMSYRRVFRVVDVECTGPIGHAHLVEHKLTLEPLFDLDDEYKAIPCKRY